VETDAHKEFLLSLPNHSGIEVLRTDFEDLKDEVGRRMPKSRSPGPNISQTREAPIVHIWHRSDDPSSLMGLKQYFQQKNCAVSIFNYASSQPEKLQSRLAICDGLVVPYSSATKSWAEDAMTEPSGYADGKSGQLRLQPWNCRPAPMRILISSIPVSSPSMQVRPEAFRTSRCFSPSWSR